MSFAQPRIAVIGAGPAGLALGSLLHSHNVHFTIYDLRSRPTEADLSEPSAMLDLHDESGLAVIRACGLYEKFRNYTSDCEESMMIMNGAGELLHEDKGGPPGPPGEDGRPEIARNNITRLFLSIFPEQGSAIRYGHKLLSATKDDSTDEVTLEFQADGKTFTETFDFVVGADGAWSRIRPLVSPIKPDATDFSYLQLYVPQITAKHPAIAERVGRGTMMAMANQQIVTTQRGTQDAMQMYAFVNVAKAGQEAVDGLNGLSILEQKKRLLEDDKLYGGFGEPLKEIVRVAFDEEHASKAASGRLLELRSLVMLPIGHSWEHKPGVTIIGDAAHVMTPFAGEGVNLAMRDALDLSKVLVEGYKQQQEQQQKDQAAFRTALSPLVRDFEKTMCERATEFAQESYDNMKTQMAEDGAEKMANFMKTIWEQFGPGGPGAEGPPPSMSKENEHEQVKGQAGLKA